MISPWGQWAPDSAGIDTKVLAEARNVLALGGAFGPVAALAAYGTNNPFTTSNPCVGMVAVRTASGGWLVFAGSRSKLYKLVASTWTDYTRLAGGDYAVPVDDYWSFAPFGANLIAVNVTDDPQVLDVDSGTANFSALGGSPPKARYVQVVGDFVVLGALASNARKVRNSAINNSAGWTVGTSLCDEQEFADGGRVTGISGGEMGYVVQEKGFRRMVFQPGQDVAFRYEHVDREVGASAGYSLAATANAIFFIADTGFYKFSETTGLVPIGANRVNKWFRDNSDTSRFFATIAFVDPFGPRIHWVFYNSSSSTSFDRRLTYDWQLDEWTYALIDCQYMTQFAAPGTTLEQLDSYGDIDSGLIPYPFDSRVWEGGRPVIAAINTSGGLSFQEGTAQLTALLRSPPRHLGQGRRTKVTAVEPLGIFNGATLGVRVGKQEHTGQTATFTASVAPSTLSGVARMIASGRLHQVELTITQSSGTAWTHAQGYDVTAQPEGAK